MPGTSRWPSLYADRDDPRDRDNAPLLAHLHVGGVDPQRGPVALDRTGERPVNYQAC